MSKRAPGLPQRPRGYWPTPRGAVIPLVPYLPACPASYVEPCAGNGALVLALSELCPDLRLSRAIDLEPQADGISKGNALDIQDAPDLFITNPPWPVGGRKGDPAISIIQHLSNLAPTWMLLPWDFAANVYFARVAASCSDIVPIGRVSWLGNGTPGKDNCAWYRFCAENRKMTVVHPRRT